MLFFLCAEDQELGRGLEAEALLALLMGSLTPQVFPNDCDISDEMPPSSFLLSVPDATKRLTIDTYICNSGYLRGSY